MLNLCKVLHHLGVYLYCSLYNRKYPPPFVANFQMIPAVLFERNRHLPQLGASQSLKPPLLCATVTTTADDGQTKLHLMTAGMCHLVIRLFGRREYGGTVAVSAMD
jgi:hypothetical protein